MDKTSIKVLGIFIRYTIIILFGLGNLFIFYSVFTPLTFYTFYYLVNIFTNPAIIDNSIIISGKLIQIVPACVAGSAFYLLFILSLSIQEEDQRKRVRILLTALAFMFALNIFRLIVLVPLINSPYFDSIHWFFWHFVSTIFVAGIWICLTYLYKIKSIPVYDDIKYLYSLIKLKKNKVKLKKK